MIMPHLEKYNVDVMDVTYNLGIQIFPMKFYINGDELADYEDMFYQNSHGIVPMNHDVVFTKKKFANLILYMFLIYMKKQYTKR